MSVWDYLFETDHDHALGDQTIEGDTQALHAAVDAVAAIRRDLLQAQHHIDRLQLVCEALVSLLELRGGLDRRELSLAIQRLDLADGVEDNRLGPDRSAAAPKCHQCGRPINPKRGRCIYCFAGIEEEGQEPENDSWQPRTICCVGCGESVLETRVLLSDRGMLCPRCSAPGA